MPLSLRSYNTAQCGLLARPTAVPMSFRYCDRSAGLGVARSNQNYAEVDWVRVAGREKTSIA